MTPEAKLTKQITEYLDWLRSFGEQIWWMKIHGGPMQRAGVPDTLVVIHGVPLFLEIKVGDSEPSKLQLEIMRRIEAAGGTCRVVYTLDDAKDAVNSIMAGHEKGGNEPCVK